MGIGLRRTRASPVDTPDTGGQDALFIRLTGSPVASGANGDYRGRVDFDAYARAAVDIVNAPLENMHDLATLFGEDSWQTAEATERDLAVLRRAKKRLRDVFEHGSSGRDETAVAELNALLEAYPMQPRISGHDTR